MSRINLKHILILNLTSDKLSPKTLIHDTEARVCNLISFLLASLNTVQMWTKSMSIASSAPNSTEGFYITSRVDGRWRKNLAFSFVSVIALPQKLLNTWNTTSENQCLAEFQFEMHTLSCWTCLDMFEIFRKSFAKCNGKRHHLQKAYLSSIASSVGIFIYVTLKKNNVFVKKQVTPLPQPFGKVWVTDAIHFTWDVCLHVCMCMWVAFALFNFMKMQMNAHNFKYMLWNYAISMN